MLLSEPVALQCFPVARLALLGCLIATGAQARPPTDDHERQKRREEIRHHLLIERDRYRETGASPAGAASDPGSGPVWRDGTPASGRFRAATSPDTEGQRPERLSAEQRRALRQLLRDSHSGADPIR